MRSLTGKEVKSVSGGTQVAIGTHIVNVTQGDGPIQTLGTITVTAPGPCSPSAFGSALATGVADGAIMGTDAKDEAEAMGAPEKTQNDILAGNMILNGAIQGVEQGARCLKSKIETK